MKRLSSIVLISSLLVVFAGIAYAESKDIVEIKTGFLTGNLFRNLDKNGKMDYATGFIDGMLISPMFDAPKKQTLWPRT